jgi:hypothetical protein
VSRCAWCGESITEDGTPPEDSMLGRAYCSDACLELSEHASPPPGSRLPPNDRLPSVIIAAEPRESAVLLSAYVRRRDLLAIHLPSVILDEEIAS